MRRLIAIVLLVLLPFQAIWAASAPYCQHEEGRASYHLGHHAHVHAQQHDQGHGDGHQHGHQDKSAAFLDHDHHCCASLTVLPTPIELPTALPSASLVATPLASYRSFDASRIERPNWTASL